MNCLKRLLDLKVAGSKSKNRPVRRRDLLRLLCPVTYRQTLSKTAFELSPLERTDYATVQSRTNSMPVDNSFESPSCSVLEETSRQTTCLVFLYSIFVRTAYIHLKHGVWNECCNISTHNKELDSPSVYLA